MSGEWRDGFLFVGNQVVLDFVNTRPVMDGQPVELLPDGTALARWLAGAGLVDRKESARLQHRWAGPDSGKKVAGLREFRERVRKAVFQIEAGESASEGFVREVNRLLAEYPYGDQIVRGKSRLERQKRFAAEDPADVYAPLAEASARLLTEADPARIRKCDTCVLHFLDISKKGTRRWCSMNLCGNRSKVAAYAQRQRETVD